VKRYQAVIDHFLEFLSKRHASVKKKSTGKLVFGTKNGNPNKKLREQFIKLTMT